MHIEVKNYISKIKEKYPEYFRNKRVLEMGSLNYNGTPREFFENCEYIGIDHMPGSCVDYVCKAHEYNNGLFDVVVTTEMLEHDKYAEKSVKNALKLLKKRGLLIATAASNNREPHYEFTGEDEHYENITKEMVVEWTRGNKCEIEQDDNLYDIRFICVRS